MTEYKLKPGQESFRVIDGPCAGRLYRSGKIYSDIPKEEAGRFVEIAEPVFVKSKKAKADEVGQ